MNSAKDCQVYNLHIKTGIPNRIGKESDNRSNFLSEGHRNNNYFHNFKSNEQVIALQNPATHKEFNQTTKDMDTTYYSSQAKVSNTLNRTTQEKLEIKKSNSETKRSNSSNDKIEMKGYTKQKVGKNKYLYKINNTHIQQNNEPNKMLKIGESKRHSTNFGFEKVNISKELAEESRQLDYLRNQEERVYSPCQTPSRIISENQTDQKPDIHKDDSQLEIHQLQETIIKKEQTIKELYHNLDQNEKSVAEISEGFYDVKNSLSEKDTEIKMLRLQASKLREENEKMKIQNLEFKTLNEVIYSFTI